jgi:hypothetical protein
MDLNHEVKMARTQYDEGSRVDSHRSAAWCITDTVQLRWDIQIARWT